MTTYNLAVYSALYGPIAIENRLSKKDMIETMRNCIKKYAPDAVDAFDCILKNTTSSLTLNSCMIRHQA